jgi:hypothetical protein
MPVTRRRQHRWPRTDTHHQTLHRLAAGRRRRPPSPASPPRPDQTCTPPRRSSARRQPAPNAQTQPEPRPAHPSHGHARGKQRSDQATQPHNRNVTPKREHGPHRNVKTSGSAWQIRTHDPVLANNRQHIHPRPSPQVRGPSVCPAVRWRPGLLRYTLAPGRDRISRWFLSRLQVDAEVAAKV